MAGTIYNPTKRRLIEGLMDLKNDTIRVALVDNSTSYSPDIDNEEFVNDVLDGGTTAQELSGTNYSRKTVGSKSFSEDDTDDEGVFDSTADITWSSLDTTEDIQGILVYKEVGGDDTTPGDDPLILYDESDADLPLATNGSDITLQWNSEGILNFS